MSDFAKDELPCMKRRTESLKISLAENNFIKYNIDQNSNAMKTNDFK